MIRPLSIPVSDVSQAGEVRRAATRMAHEAGLPEVKRGEVAIVATELATNLARYGRDGRVILQVSTEPGMGLGATSVTSLTDKVFQLARIDPDLHAPPIVTFIWNHHLAGDSLDVRLGGQNRDSFKGVIESIRQKFTLFSPEGIPLRATLNVVLREYRTLDEQLTQLNLKSPDRTRSHTVRGGETLSAIATEEWERPEEWRRIADENAIEDPRRLRPGAFLDIPVISPR